ncbi:MULTISPECIES: radical SAM protein [Gordonibacter]|uniref:Radical SAM protein n=1 Tax=Gordonibacter faecis TaxID=3047475 RepID=A0ABT7DM53_9ACTN|nr:MULTISPECIES: radical SAM protein [unclassified Gordonibacter]MDJ1650588.1 radical SAM protein [Gordonibacter sp. KGMB12511]HIW75756.1 radical SAM protein [Candidatus Gordonibacter avicola]
MTTNGAGMGNEAVERALAEYAAVGERYVRELERKGLVFAEANAGASRCAELRAELAARGVQVRNAGASLSVGHLSPACVECTGNRGSETFSTTFKCHRDCYFCFNHNQPDYEKFFREGCPWEETLARSAAENESLACVGLTGGEPLLDLENALRLLKRTDEVWPDAHTRLYTSGDLLTEESATLLQAAGLDEIRFSVKDDDAPDQQDRVIAALRLAKRFIPSVMVEMPVIPGAKEHMQDLFRRFQEVGIDGINLLEFCFPFCNWDEFARRGFVLKNPPFEVMYDYGYSGGLAVDGSEELILELMQWALDEGLTFGMHYCSLENKHRSEIRQKNEPAAHAHPCLTFDESDFFLKTAKVFGPDIPVARPVLEAAGCTDFMEDTDEDSLAFPLRFLDVLRDLTRPDDTPLTPMTCFFVHEHDEGGSYLIDVALRPAPEHAG